MTEMYWDGDSWAVQWGHKFYLGLSYQEAHDMMRRLLYYMLTAGVASQCP